MTDIADSSGQPTPAGSDDHGRGNGGQGGDVGRILAVVNTALVGVPGAYAVSNSVTVTAIATVMAIALVVAYLKRLGR